jgi:hypothetical protein
MTLWKAQAFDTAPAGHRKLTQWHKARLNSRGGPDLVCSLLDFKKKIYKGPQIQTPNLYSSSEKPPSKKITIGFLNMCGQKQGKLAARGPLLVITLLHPRSQAASTGPPASATGLPSCAKRFWMRNAF